MTLRRALPFLLVFTYFVFMIQPGLTFRFAPDDPMNIHGYWSKPPGEIASAVLLVVTSSYRPMGALFYLPLYYAFGLNPLPYRVVIFVLLGLNLWLLYCLGKRLGGSETSGALAALFGGYHASALGVYVSTAVVYDVLCYLFLTGAVLYYVRIRQGGRTLALRETAILVLLYGAALDSKEMAVVLPAVLLVYELLFDWRPGLAVLRPVMVCGLLAAGFSFAILYGPHTVTALPPYHPDFSIHQYMKTTRTYTAMLFFREDMLSERLTELFWLILFLLSALLRRRDMAFGAAFALIAYLPLNFVTVREGYALYIPLIGFALWTSGLVSALLPKERQRASGAVLVACMALMLAVHYPKSRELEPYPRHAQELTWNVISEFKRVNPRVERNSRLLFRDNPWGESWDMYLIARLWFGDPTLKVSMTWPGKDQPYGDEHFKFDHVFRWADGQLVQER